MDLLWSGTAYRELALWRERHPGALTAVEEDFARAMNEQTGRRRRHQMIAAAAFVVLLVILEVIGTLLRQTDHALDQAVAEESRAQASRLVALGRLEMSHYPSAAVASARLSLGMADTVGGRMLALEEWLLTRRSDC